MNKFKIGKYVRISEEHEEKQAAETDEVWIGKITNILNLGGKNKIRQYEVELDTQSLNSMSESYLEDKLDSLAAYEVEVIFCSEEEMELAACRDDKKTRVVAAARIQELEDAREEEESPEAGEEAAAETYYEDFVETLYFQGLNEREQYNSDFIVDCFIRYGINYEGAYCPKYTLGQVERICLYWMVGKVTAEIEFYEDMPNVLIAFFKFLGEDRKIRNHEAVGKLLHKMRLNLMIKSQNPANWHSAKSFMMPAVLAGIDMSDENQKNQYLLSQQMKALQQIKHRIDDNLSSLNEPDIYNNVDRKDKVLNIAQPNLYKNIGRNDKVNVKYNDGSIKNQVKFKTVEVDLKAGKCVLE